MPISIKTNLDSQENLTIEINNGDLNALNEITETWKFKDKESALRFALAVLKVTKPGSLHQEKEDGSKSTLLPMESLTNKE
jgi:hypothetical protein